MRLLKITSRMILQKRFSKILTSPLGNLRVPNISLQNYIFEHLDKKEGSPFITCGETDKTYSYGEIKLKVDNFSYALTQKIGIRPGEVIGLVLPNIPEFAIAIYGALKAGLVVTFVNPLYTADEIKRQFLNAEVTCIVTTVELKSKAEEISSEIMGYKGTITVGRGGEWDLLDLSNVNPSLKPIDINVDPKNLAILPYSSGTTGLPKGVMLSHYNCVANLEQILHPTFFQDKGIEIALSVLPFFHIYGFNGILNAVARRGVHLVVLNKFTPENYIKCLKKYKPTLLYLVPSLLMFLASHPSITREHLSSIRNVACGAAPATKSLIDLFKDKVGRSDILIQQGYGMTESSPCSLITPHYIPETKTGSTGILVPATEAKVVCMKTGKLLPANQSGELYIRGPQVMLGYFKNEKATQETLDSDNWLHTGDVAHYDDDGYFYITDRTKELIKVKGNQVSPTELESVIIKMPGVLDAAVIGIEESISGELPVAFVVCKPDISLSEIEVQKFVEDKVAPYKKLAGGVKFLKAIPRNAAGKILRRELKALL